MTIGMLANVNALRGSPYIRASLIGRFIKEASEAVRLPEFPGARIGGIDGKLWCHQHRVHSGGRDLRRHLLPVAYVLRQIGAVAVKKHDHDRGTFGVEAWRNVQQHAVVTESLRLPENMAAEIDVAPVALSTGVQKRSARFRHGAVVREGRRLEINETCQCAGVRRAARRNGVHGRCRALERCEPDSAASGSVSALSPRASPDARPRSATSVRKRLRSRATILATAATGRMHCADSEEKHLSIYGVQLKLQPGKKIELIMEPMDQQ